MVQNHIYKMQLGGRELVIESGKYAEQADGNVIVRCGDTAVMVNATASKAPRDGIDFFPLSIEFEEKLYSVGKIPGGFIKREGRPSEKAILASRLIDRPLRPLFPKGYYNDVQVIATVMSVDTDIPPEVYAMIGSSAALSISGLPFMGPTGSVVVGLVDGEYIINPNSEQREKSRMHLTVSGTKDAIMMVEAGAKEVTEEEMLNGILFAHEEIKKICDFIQGIKDEIGKPAKEVEIYHAPEEIDAAVREYAKDKVVWSVDTFDRKEREQRQSEITEDIQAHFAEQFPEHAKDIDTVIYNMTKETVREKIKHGIRPDGRKLNEVRPIWCETGLFARTHGSAVFTRGQTQVMTIVTLGAIGDGQTLDGISDQDFKRYMHHYNMPPYSTGEAKALRSSNRREIGHGALAERAIEPMLPSEEEFPYAIRAVSEVISSNGSTSQGSICASSMALMDAGVPLKKVVAGCAMGLIKDEETGEITILTDIQGLEDFFGDMDFKVAGTKDGITAIQMDIKIKGIDREILERALAQANEGRMHIMGEMNKVISEPRKELSKYAPKIIQFTIDPDKIREVIGSGGKTINKIIADTGVKIDIEDDGRVFISTPDDEAAKKAKNIIMGIVKDVKVGEIYKGRVTRIMQFGAFVELLPGKEGLVHISKLDNKRVEKVEDVVNVGDEIMVKVIEIDKQNRINLSHKAIRPGDKPTEF
ncbi:MAG: polyribonucleotide nucleotidyltransferase [Christensenellaceae bacterium]|nr:polyribonucleotide nucleotidyltransferase [Christensenellaceae bacterium]